MTNTFFILFFTWLAVTTVIRNFDYECVVKYAYISAMDEQTFRQFIAERPALNLSALADELGMDRVNLTKVITGLRKIPKAKRGLFYNVAQKYGFNEPSCRS